MSRCIVIGSILVLLLSSMSAMDNEATTMTKVEERNIFIHSQLRRNTCDINDNYWQLIHWFFERTTYIEVTEIHRKGKGYSRFANNIIQQLGQKTQSLVRTFSVEFDQDEPEIAGEYRRRQFYASATEADVVRQIYINMNVTKVKRARRDEPELGALVYTSSASMLHDYIVQTPRRTFANPAGNFVIILMRPLVENVSTIVVARIMEQLWRYYRMLNALLILSCDSQEYVGYYDPFDESATDGSWGAMKWILLQDIDYESAFLLNKAENFRRHPFRAAIFRRYPTLISATELPDTFRSSYFADASAAALGYAGLDALIMGNLAKVHNFPLIEVKSEKYGQLLPNQSFSGAVGDILYERADVAFNSRFIIDYDTKDIDFVYPVFADRFCFIAPSSLAIPGWTAIFRCFRVNVWIVILLIDLVCILFWYALQCFTRRISGRIEPPSIVKVAFDLFYIKTSSPTILPVHLLERIFLVGCLVSNLIIVGTFQGSLTRSFSTPAYEPEIDTLHQLDKSELPLRGSSQTIKNIFGTEIDNDSPVVRSLRSKCSSNAPNESAIDSAARFRNMVGIERFSDFAIMLQTLYQRPDGTSTVHIVKECPRDYHLAYIVKKGSPYRARFNRVLLRFFEGGLLMKWYELIEHNLIMAKSHQQHIGHSKVLFAFSMEDMYTAFMILVIGLAVSFSVFLYENLARYRFYVGQLKWVIMGYLK